MKIILAGSSGFIGGEVLLQCLQNPAITSLIVLSRRELPQIASRDPRIEVIVLQDFKAYPDSVLQKISGAKICIWALGSKSNPTKPGMSYETEVEYPLTAAKAILAASKPEMKPQCEKIRFVFVGGIFCEREQEKSLWFLQEVRRARGLAEAKLLGFAEEHQGVFETVIVRSGVVVRRESYLPDWLPGINRFMIRVDELAAAMVDSALRGEGTKTLENSMVRSMGKVLL